MTQQGIPLHDGSADETSRAGGPRPPSAGQQVTITVGDEAARGTYANFFRITTTPEELILDLGLNPQLFAPGESTVRVTERVVLNFYTAKRLLGALTAAVQRHEQAFGVVETDVMKRARPR